MNLKEIFKSRQSLSDLPTQHDWVLQAKNFSPPRKDIEALSKLNLPAAVLEKAVCGVTTYMWQCAITGELRKQEILGSDSDELAELVDKVDKGGMQYIRMNGNTYAIAQWAPPKVVSE